MFNLNFTKRFSQVLVFLVLLVTIADFAWAEVKYNPYPIIFVHGYNNPPERFTKEDLWSRTRYNFKKFFEYHPTVTSTDFKYWNKDWENYMAVFDYRAESNGDLDEVADKLGIYIDDILDKLPDDIEQKVIVVTHSSGGLVTRRLLAKDNSYQNKIERVIFIGTPHLGSPLASGVILADRMIPELKKTYEEHHKWTGIDRNLDFNWQFTVYSDRDKQITDALNLFNKVVNWDVKVSIQEMLAGDKNKPNPYVSPDPKEPGRYNPNVLHHEGQGVAVGQLVVPQTVTATTTFVASAFSTSAGAVVETESLIAKSFYDKDDTFLYNYTFARPNNFKIIQGTGSIGAWLLGKSGGALFKSLANYEGLPAGNTFDDLDNGDGIVTPMSQIAIAPEGEIYQVKRSHITETNAWETILQAIDDKPVIESVRFIMGPPADGSDYIIVKVKDYLLADIEIVQLTGADLTDFHAKYGDPYKPYFRYPDKGFLTERDVEVEISPDKFRKIHLMPGEFHAKLKDRLGPGYVCIRMKNPAGEETVCETVLVKPSNMSDGVWRHVTLSGWNGPRTPDECGPQPPGPRFQQFRENAINEFKKKFPYSYNSSMGGWAYSDLSASAFVYEPYLYPYCYCWHIEAESSIAPSLNFDLALSKPVKSAGLIGTFQFENYKGKKIGEKIIEEKKVTDEGMNFNVSFLNENDNVAFKLDTTSYKSDDMFEIPIDPQYLNLGSNTWTFSAGFLEEGSLITNCFPDYYIEPPILKAGVPPIWSHIIYNQQAYIDNPLLVITFEEDVQN